MPRDYFGALVLAFTAPALASCVATQVQENTLEMVNSVSRVREVQVFRNMAAAISDHDMVPTEMLLTVGQANVTAGATPSVKYPKFSINSPTREFDLSATDTWTAQWQATPVTNADDLRRLRNLYVLIVSTDDQYNALEKYYGRHPELRASIECYGLQTSSPPNPGNPDSRAQPSAPGPGAQPSAPSPGTQPSSQTPGKQFSVYTGQSPLCPAGYGAGVIPKWKEGLEIIEVGDSIGCRIYQEATMEARRKSPEPKPAGVPFKRWLFWRAPGGAWQPSAPDTAPEPLGTFGGWELGTTSRACLNDFVLLVQSATPQAASAAEGVKLMLNTQ